MSPGLVNSPLPLLSCGHSLVVALGLSLPSAASCGGTAATRALQEVSQDITLLVPPPVADHCVYTPLTGWGIV